MVIVVIHIWFICSCLLKRKVNDSGDAGMLLTREKIILHLYYKIELKKKTLNIIIKCFKNKKFN